MRMNLPLSGQQRQIPVRSRTHVIWPVPKNKVPVGSQEKINGDNAAKIFDRWEGWAVCRGISLGNVDQSSSILSLSNKPLPLGLTNQNS